MSVRHRPRPAALALCAVVIAFAAGAPPASAASSRFAATTRSGDVTLTLTGAVKHEQIAIYSGMTMTLRSASTGNVLRRKLVASARESWGMRPTVRLADVSGDGRPDALVDTFSGGAHCCSVATIAVSTGTGTWAKPFRAAWDGGYRLRDLGARDGVLEIVAVDQRFDYLFASHAGSARPVTVSRATPDGKLVDISTQFPNRLRVDANFWIGEWSKLGPVAGETAEEAQQRGYPARSTLAAALASLLRVGALDEAKQLSAQAVARGDFRNLLSDADGIFKTDVARQLQEMGFLSDASVLGLPR